MPSAVWSGHLHFGLVVMPVRLLVAARPKTTRFRRLYRSTGNHVMPPMQLPPSRQTFADEDSYSDGAGESGIDTHNRESSVRATQYDYAPVRQVLQSEVTGEVYRSFHETALRPWHGSLFINYPLQHLNNSSVRQHRWQRTPWLEGMNMVNRDVMNYAYLSCQNPEMGRSLPAPHPRSHVIRARISLFRSRVSPFEQARRETPDSMSEFQRWSGERPKVFVVSLD
jgi:hypothetical protein